MDAQRTGRGHLARFRKHTRLRDDDNLDDAVHIERRAEEIAQSRFIERFTTFGNVTLHGDPRVSPTRDDVESSPPRVEPSTENRPLISTKRLLDDPLQIFSRPQLRPRQCVRSGVSGGLLCYPRPCQSRVCPGGICRAIPLSRPARHRTLGNGSRRGLFCGISPRNRSVELHVRRISCPFNSCTANFARLETSRSNSIFSVHCVPLVAVCEPWTRRLSS